MFWDLYAKTYDKATLSFSAYSELITLLKEAINLQESDSLLDLGCGTGNLEKELVKNDLNFRIEALDISKNMLDYAKKKINDHRVTFKLFDLNNRLDYKDNSFDKAVMVHSLYTLNNPIETLKEVKRVLKPNGLLIIVNPFKDANMQLMMDYEKKKSGVLKFYWKLFLVLPAFIINKIIALRARNSQYHFYTEDEYSELLSKSGYNQIDVKKVYADQSIFLRSKINK